MPRLETQRYFVVCTSQYLTIVTLGLDIFQHRLTRFLIKKIFTVKIV